MKDKIIKLQDGLEYIVIDSLTLNQKTYVYCVQVDNESEMLTQNFIICEIKFNGDKVTVDNINNKDEYEMVANTFVSRLKD